MTTQGLEVTMERPSPVVRFFMAVVAWAERLNLACSKVGNPPVYDNCHFSLGEEDRGGCARYPRRA